MTDSHSQDRGLPRSPEAAAFDFSAHDASLGDGDRLSALRQSRLLDTPPEPAFDRLTELARRLLGVPVALVSLVDGDRQFFKSQQGLPEPVASERETPLSYSFCQYVVAEDAPFVVEDARTHPLVQDNLATRDLGVVAYLGVPVHSPGGQPLGSICAIDTEPRAWTDDDRAVLLNLAAIVESEIGLRAEVAAHTRSETQFRALFEASPDAVLVLDPETETVLEANSAACALYGCTRDELSWASLQTLLHGPAVGTDIVAWLNNHGGTARYETVQFRADGTPFDVAVGASLVRLDGRPVVLAVNRDVTERNRVARTSTARAAFRETLADELRALGDPTEIKAVATRLLGEYLQASRVHYGEVDEDAFVVVDRDYTDGSASLTGRFRMEDFDPALARAHDAGQSVVTPDVANAIELSDPDRAAYAAAGVAAQVCVPLVKGGRLVSVLAVHQREPRDWTAAEVALVEETAERVWSTLERARAEGALRESEERLQLVAQATNDAVWDWDVRAETVVMNDAFTDIFGWAAPADGGFTIGWMLEHVHPDDRDRVADSIPGAFKGGGQRWREEYRFERADGTWADVVTRGHIVRSTDGMAVRIVGTMVDLTARKATERALVEAKEAAEEVARAKSSLLMNMSHEIRTPLTAVIGYAELLGDECGPEQTEQREYATAIEQGGRRLLDTLNSVLDLAQIEAGALPLATVAVDLRAEAEAAVFALRLLAQADGLTLSITGPATAALADRPALARVLTNLVGNAIKFTDRGSVTVDVWAEAGAAWLRVSDTGVGIGPAFLPHVFDDFKQESSGANRSHEGSGLGLAITRGLVVKMGGSITVESEKGVGSTFTVRLPAP